MTDYTKGDLERIGKKWGDRILQAEKREENWLKGAKNAETIYLADDSVEGAETADFPILHSNVETIVSSIYNSTPSPDIRVMHDGGGDKQADKLAKNGAALLERAVAAQMDNNSLDIEVEASAQDVLVAGRGLVRVKVDAADDDPADVRVMYEAVAWCDYREGPAKRWRDVPWVAYRHSISSEEKQRLEDEDISAAYGDDVSAEEEEKDCDIWEIWDKASRQVIFLIEESNKIITFKDDPLGLKGFFPQSAPVQPIMSTHSRTPVCPYEIYRMQAEELDRITRRIDKIVSGLKVRGLIAGDAEAAELLADADDNTLTVAPDIQNISVAGGLDRMIMWWPIETAIAVLRELYVQREQVKTAIYEITGISDIIRGQGAASETATAQNIKTQWGSLRIKKAQRAIERQVRDLIQLSVEIIAGVFPDEAVQRASGMQLTPELLQFIRQPHLFYRIDVESDSTVRADVGKQREEMSAFLQATGAYTQAMAPIVAQSPKVAPLALELFASFARRFSLGKQAEDALDQMVEMMQQASEKPDPQAEQMKEMQMREAQAGVAGAEADVTLKQAEAQLKAAELQIKQAESQGKAAELQQKQSDSQAAQYKDALEMQDKRELDARKLDLEERKLQLDADRLEIEAARAAKELEDDPLDGFVRQIAVDNNGDAMGMFKELIGMTQQTQQQVAERGEATEQRVEAVTQALAAMAEQALAPKRKSGTMTRPDGSQVQVDIEEVDGKTVGTMTRPDGSEFTVEVEG